MVVSEKPRLSVCGVDVRMGCRQIVHAPDTNRATAAGFGVMVMIGFANMPARLTANADECNHGFARRLVSRPRLFQRREIGDQIGALCVVGHGNHHARAGHQLAGRLEERVERRRVPGQL